jgi:tight adherence protein B
MPFELEPVYLVYGLAAASAALFVQAVYAVFFSATSYRSRINRRLRLSKDQPDRESVLVQLRRERGLTSGGHYALPTVKLNRLILQSGLTLGLGKFLTITALVAVLAFGAVMIVRASMPEAAAAALLCGLALPWLALRFLRSRRHKKFGAQFPDALDIIVRSLRAGHPVPVAIAMVARELPDPVGTEFGIAADEVTYGADLETAMRNLYFRVGQEDLPLFVTAVAIQSSTGGNLSEILQNLSSVIRLRFKMRRKVRALAAEGRFSALLLSAVPLVLFGLLKIAAPDFYASVWHHSATQVGLGAAAAWMLAGNYVMYRMVNFRI